MQQRMPQQSWSPFKDNGHGVNMTAPEQCVSEVRKFLAERRQTALQRESRQAQPPLNAISLLGADRIVIGTDNYATMDVEHPNALVEKFETAGRRTRTHHAEKRGKTVPSWLTTTDRVLESEVLCMNPSGDRIVDE